VRRGGGYVPGMSHTTFGRSGHLAPHWSYSFPELLSRAAAYVKQLQSGVSNQEKALSEYKLYVAERYASKEYLSETKREILDSIRDLARRIEHP
jgi:hypothetical protein